jgi:hypothetical protein
MSSPTVRTNKYYRDLGYTVDIAEHHNTFAGKKKDLFGFIDIVAIGHGETIGIQATSTGNVNARYRKITEGFLGKDKEPDLTIPERALVWLESGNSIVVIGWKKYKKRVDNKLWRPTIRQVTIEDVK